MKREAAEVVKRILLFDEKLDLQLFAALREEGYNVEEKEEWRGRDGKRGEGS